MQTTTNTEQWEGAEAIIGGYKANPSSPIMLLIDLQEEYNYLPAEVLEMASSELQIPLGRLYGLGVTGIHRAEPVS